MSFPRASGNEGLDLSWHRGLGDQDHLSNPLCPFKPALLPPPPLRPGPTVVIPLTNQTLPRTVRVGGTRAGPHLRRVLAEGPSSRAEWLGSCQPRPPTCGGCLDPPSRLLLLFLRSPGNPGHLSPRAPGSLAPSWSDPGLSEPSPRALGHEKQPRCVRGPDTQAQLCPRSWGCT